MRGLKEPRVSIAMEPELYRRFARLAKAAATPVSTVVRDLVEEAAPLLLDRFETREAIEEGRMKALGEALESLLDQRALDPIFPDLVTVRLSEGELRDTEGTGEARSHRSTSKRPGKSA